MRLRLESNLIPLNQHFLDVDKRLPVFGEGLLFFEEGEFSGLLFFGGPVVEEEKGNSAKGPPKNASHLNAEMLAFESEHFSIEKTFERNGEGKDRDMLFSL